ncbi:MAG: hypothetical protein NW226_08090 [Microscillaceae bacterium]|nr:hypothetical protein [Microscillaceae bacterium]
MMSTERKLKLKLDEIPAVGQFIYDSYLADEADFKAFSPQFDETYKTDLAERFNTVKEIINAKVITAELKVVTARMYENISVLKEQINRLEAYAKLAKTSLKVVLADFRFKEVRRLANKKDFEGLIENLKITIQMVSENMEALQAKGFTQESKTALETMRIAFETDNAEQNRKLDQRRQHVANNNETINALYEKLSEILTIGKVLYKKSKPEKAKSYTLAEIRKRVSIPRKTNKEEKTVQ